MKALIVYGTRYGATASTSEEIGKVLQNENYDVRILDAKKEKIQDISDYDLVIVGSGIKINNWTKEPENFLKKFKSELSKKKVAIFVSSATRAIYENEKNSKELDKAQKKYLDEKAEKYSLKPVAMTIFGGVLNYDEMGFLTRKTVGQLWRKYEEMGIKKQNGTYDTRNWENIRSWTKQLIKK